jgi:hypothetical protein
MANVKTWYTDMNVLVTDGTSTTTINGNLLWGLKALLKGDITGSHGINGAAPTSSYWTCVRSSDGVTATNSDLWGTSSYDHSKMVYGDNLTNYAGQPLSWMTLRSPEDLTPSGPLYLLLLYSGPDATQTVGAFISNTAFTSGTTESRPTSSTEISLGGITDNNNMTLYLGSTQTGTYKYHLCRTSNGTFWFAASKNGSNMFGRLLGVGSVSEVRSPEGQPWYGIWYDASNNYTTDILKTNLFSNFNIPSRTHNNLYDTYLNIIRPVGGDEGGNDAFDRPSTNVQGDLDSFPAYLFYKGSNQSVQFTSVGLKGRLDDVFISSYLPGAVYPASGDVEKVAVGSIWLPFDVAPQL